MYTSGWPKNQNTCWNSTGSPPPAALKKLVPKWMSISIMVTHAGQHRHHRDQQEGGDQPGPDEQRHLHQGHAGRAQVEDGGDHVDRAHDRADAHQVHGEDEEGDALRRVGGRQRRVEGPAEVRPATGGEQGTDQQTEGRRQQPEAEVVHPRQRHVRRADHQRDHPVGQTDEGRHHRTEDHDQAVHGGHLVEELRLHDLQAGLEQLGADHHGHGRRPAGTWRS